MLGDVSQRMGNRLRFQLSLTLEVVANDLVELGQIESEFKNAGQALLGRFPETTYRVAQKRLPRGADRPGLQVAPALERRNPRVVYDED